MAEWKGLTDELKPLCPHKGDDVHYVQYFQYLYKRLKQSSAAGVKQSEYYREILRRAREKFLERLAAIPPSTELADQQAKQFGSATQGSNQGTAVVSAKRPRVEDERQPPALRS
jgi:hypothetical protein